MLSLPQLKPIIFSYLPMRNIQHMHITAHYLQMVCDRKHERQHLTKQMLQ